jgi:protein O-GlcNAc transferase
MAHRGFATAVEHQRAGRLDLAEQLYADVPEGDPSYGNATFLRASIALAQGRGATAIELFQKALTLDPKNSAYRSGIAEAYRRLGSLPLAFDHFEAVLQQEPRLGEAAFRLGLLLEQLGALEPALACYEHAREVLSESSPDASRAVLERLDAARTAFLSGPPALSSQDSLVARA